MAAPASSIPFTDVKVGVRGRIVAAPSESPQELRLQEMGMTVGTEFKVTKVAPLGDPVEIELRGYRLCLRRLEAAGFRFVILE